MLEHNLELGEISGEFSQVRKKVLFGVQYRDILQVVVTRINQLPILGLSHQRQRES